MESSIGDDPFDWSVGMHDSDGHAPGPTSPSRDGETALYHEMNALMFQNGIEYAEDDVSGASLEIRRWFLKRVTWR